MPLNGSEVLYSLHPNVFATSAKRSKATTYVLLFTSTLIYSKFGFTATARLEGIVQGVVVQIIILSFGFNILLPLTTSNDK